MDLKPYIFKTSDYGKTWSKITNGITDKHTFARVVRADKKNKGLLYAGTETGLYLSLDDGENWQKFQLNLPVVPINDITIQDNDLVVATAGRSFWILDDVGAIQNSFNTVEKLKIVQPKPSYRIFGGSQDKPVPGLGQNPKSGVTVDYYLPKKLDSTELKLEVLKDGKVIRSYTNQKPKDFKSWPGGPSKPALLPSKKGYNRFTWDFRSEQLPSIEKVFVFGNSAGHRIGPGNYTLRITLEDEVVETTAAVLANPSIVGTTSDYAEQQTVLQTIDATVKEMHKAVNQMRSAKSQLTNYQKLLENNEETKALLEKGKDLKKRITAWEENLIQPKQKTFQDVINFNNPLNADLLHLKGFVDVAEPKVTQGAKERLKDLLTDWKIYKTEKNKILGEEIKSYNTIFKSLNLPALLLKED
jgi:hypothetical protein